MTVEVIQSLAVVTSVYNSAIHLTSGGGITGWWPDRNMLASVSPEYGEVLMRVVSPSRPVRVTITAGGQRTVMGNALLAYEGPMTLLSDECAITDGMGSNTQPFSLADLGLTPGTHHMLVQVNGRIMAAVRERIETDRLMMMTAEEVAAVIEADEEPDPDPIEHWFISFPDVT